jgi:glycosyltransferase involved in cell wall biosynthesis
VSGLRAIHQFIPSVVEGDATANHALAVRSLLRGLGYRSEIYAERTGPGLEAEAHHYTGFRVEPASAVIYQFAIGSVLTDALLAAGVPLSLNYHNLTPPELFERWEPGVAHGLWWGRHQLSQMVPATRLGIGVSEFNRLDLERAGYEQTTVAPILLDPADFDGEVDDALVERLAGAGTAWLFVGRLAPNKAQHDLVKAFAVYRRVFEPTARLWLVGGPASTAYHHALRALVASVGLEGAVTLTGAVSPAQLAAYYRAADVFVCLSDHEGFGVPLLEAMHHRLPVIAHAAAAVPETVAGGGLCLPGKRPAVVAAAVHRIVSDPSLRAALVAAGGRRLAELSGEASRARFTAAVGRFVELV